MNRILCEFGDFTVAYEKDRGSCRDSIVIRHRGELGLEVVDFKVRDRVLSLLLYDMVQGYSNAKLSDLKGEAS